MRVLAGAAAVASLLLLAGCRQPGPQPAEGRKLTDATYIFLGTVLDSARPAGEVAPAGAKARAARVDRVYYQKGTFEDQTGKTVALLGATEGLEVGRQYVLFTDPVAFGRSVSVELIGTVEDEAAGAAASEEAKRAQQLGPIRERLLQAEIVAAGRIVKIRPFERRARYDSEHDPDLQWAVLETDRVLKGEPPGREVSFLFAASDDVQWYRAPKPQEGEEAIFLLSREAKRLEALGVSPGELTLLGPLDVQPTEKIELIEAMLRGEVGGEPGRRPGP